MALTLELAAALSTPSVEVPVRFSCALAPTLYGLPGPSEHASLFMPDLGVIYNRDTYHYK